MLRYVGLLLIFTTTRWSCVGAVDFSLTGDDAEQICATMSYNGLTALCSTSYPYPEASANLESCPGGLLDPVQTLVPDVTIPSVPTVTVPTVPIPDIPTVTTPTVTFPSVDVPRVTTPTVTIPSVPVPQFNVPSVTVPSVPVPRVNVPPVTVPSVPVPRVNVPPVTVPSVPVPHVNVPTVTTPPSWHVPSAPDIFSGRRLRSNGCEVNMASKSIPELYPDLQGTCNAMPNTASLCDCFSQQKSELAKASLDALSNSGSQLDPASALVYEAYADIADCFTKMLDIQDNSADVTAGLAESTIAPIFGYHEYYKFSAVVAGCAGSLGSDCTQGLIDFFTGYFNELSDSVLKTIGNALSDTAATYLSAADTLSAVKDNAAATLAAMSDAASSCQSYNAVTSFASSDVYTQFSTFNDLGIAIDSIRSVSSTVSSLATTFQDLQNGFLPYLTDKVSGMVSSNNFDLSSLIPFAQLSKLESVKTVLSGLPDTASLVSKAGNLRNSISGTDSSALTSALSQCGSDAATRAAQLLTATDTGASKIQESSFQLPTTVNYDFGVATVKTWVHINVDVPCSELGSYCISQACVDYPKFYKCTIDKDEPLMPEFLPWAKVKFT